MRTCSVCGKKMDEGFCIEGGMAYYCTEECLYTVMTPEEWDELYDDDGDSYWTQWEIEDEEEEQKLEGQPSNNT